MVQLRFLSRLFVCHHKKQQSSTVLFQICEFGRLFISSVSNSQTHEWDVDWDPRLDHFGMLTLQPVIQLLTTFVCWIIALFYGPLFPRTSFYIFFFSTVFMQLFVSIILFTQTALHYKTEQRNAVPPYYCIVCFDFTEPLSFLSFHPNTPSPFH